MFGNTYYKMKMNPEVSGIEVRLITYVSIHESPCFDFCIDQAQSNSFRYTILNRKKGESVLQCAKRFGYTVKRIDKHSGRFAFKTKEEAFKHLRFLKSRQIKHLERELEVLKMFMEQTDGLTYDDLRKYEFSPLSDVRIVPGTKPVIDGNFFFY